VLVGFAAALPLPHLDVSSIPSNPWHFFKHLTCLVMYPYSVCPIFIHITSLTQNLAFFAFSLLLYSVFSTLVGFFIFAFFSFSIPSSPSSRKSWRVDLSFVISASCSFHQFGMTTISRLQHDLNKHPC
jgi:hypothetical protein